MAGIFPFCRVIFVVLIFLILMTGSVQRLYLYRLFLHFETSRFRSSNFPFLFRFPLIDPIGSHVPLESIRCPGIDLCVCFFSILVLANTAWV